MGLVLALLAAVLAPQGSAPADATITVVDEAGTPQAEAAVSCTRGAQSIALTDGDGRCTVSAGCRAVACMRGGFVSGSAEIAGRSATCALERAVVLRGRVAVASAATLYARLLVWPEGRAVTSAPLFGDDASGAFRIDTVPPGTYAIELSDPRDAWTCTTVLGALPAGPRDLDVPWHGPLELRGTVLDADGRPYPRVLLKVNYDATPAGAGASWCETSRSALDVVSDGVGRFTADVDPARAYRIVADSAWEPATIRIER